MHSNSFYAAYKKYIFMYTIWNSSNQKWWTQLILDNVSVGVVPNEPKVIYMYHACIYTIFFKTPCIILFCWLTMQITNFSLYIIKSSVLQSKAMHIYITLVTSWYLRCNYRLDCYQNILMFIYRMVSSGTCKDIERFFMGEGQSNNLFPRGRGRGEALEAYINFAICHWWDF